jgi:hypothetical protein
MPFANNEAVLQPERVVQIVTERVDEEQKEETIE